MAKPSKLVRHAFSERWPVVLEFSGPGRTKQSFKDECDINRIMSRYAATGVLDFVERREAQFADVSGYDFQAAMQLISDAQSSFNALGADIRERFENDPAKLLNFLDDPKNMDEAVELGFLVRKAVDGLPGAGGAAGSTATAAAPKGAGAGGAAGSTASKGAEVGTSIT